MVDKKKKKTVGIPDGFSIKVKPVELGDYLDETSSSRPSPVQLRRRAAEVEPVDIKEADPLSDVELPGEATRVKDAKPVISDQNDESVLEKQYDSSSVVSEGVKVTPSESESKAQKEPQREVKAQEETQQAPTPPEPKKDIIRLRKDEVTDSPQKKKPKSFKRKQINMTPKTLERFGELVNYVQEYSQQPDAAASEVMEAIISAHFEALQALRLGKVPARGRWGSPTAQAFKDALSKAFTDALIEHHTQSMPRSGNG